MGSGSGSDDSLNNSHYRYGFNGKENDNEIKGIGNQQDYGMRIYDPRISRFLSVDPITKDYPELTPYQFASNTPIQAIDIDGEEGYSLNSDNERLKREGEAMLKQLDYRYNALARYPTTPQATLSSAKPAKNEYELARQEAVNKREFDKVGRNPDGTQKPITQLLNNNTYGKFAENVVMPLIEGYTMASGLGELRAIYKGLTYMGRREFFGLATEGVVNPKAIRFSQYDISATFKNGGDFQSLIANLKNGTKVNIPPISIVDKEGMVFSLDNRRLYVFKKAGVDIPYVKLNKIPENQLFKFSTENNSTSIKIKPSNK